MKRKMFLIVGCLFFLLLSGILYIYIVFYPQFPIANGYAAKKMCSCTFIAGRSQESIQSEDLAFGPIGLTKSAIDRDEKRVTSTLFGFAPRVAEYRDDVGCVLLIGDDNYNTSLTISKKPDDPVAPWPYGNGETSNSVEGVSYNKLETAMKNAFDKSMKMDSVNTRALLVIYKDTLVGEVYAKGFDKYSEILGWSMTKSVTATMIGMLIKDGELSLDDDHLFESWTDERSKITLRDMLQMQSGLEFEEDYAAISDAMKMLYMSEDVSSIPESQPAIHKPGSHWSYSSGTTNLLSKLIRERIGDQQAYLEFPHERIFKPLGMTSAVLETDESGVFIGSSYMYATPRDWAKFGRLFLQNGSWEGEQLIDSSFIDFIKSPAANSNGMYGGHFWLNVGHSQFPDVPEDAFMCLGFQGQQVIVIPSQQAIIVRMGLAEYPIYDPNKVISEILESLDPI